MNSETEYAKYLLDGSAVVVIEATKAGVLCYKLYEREGEQIESDEIICVPKVYDTAPTEKLDERVKYLENRIAELQIKRTALDQDQRESEARQREIQSKFDRHAQLKTLMDYIDGKITHYVIEHYWSWEIIPFNKALCGSEDYKKPLKLLTLFGSSCGQLDWRLNYYRDGSGGSDLVYPATSEAEALEIVRRMILEKSLEGLRDEVVAAAQKYGAELPQEYRQAVRNMKVKNLEEQMKTTENTRLRILGELAQLNTPCPTTT